MRISDVLKALRTPGILTVRPASPLEEKFPRNGTGKSKARAPQDFSSETCVSPVEILHELSVATSFFTRTPFADAEQLWRNLRHCGMLGTYRKPRNPREYLVLANSASDVVYYYKATQSERLGIGLAIVVAKRRLHKRYPDHVFHAVDAEFFLNSEYAGRIGSRLRGDGTGGRPDYFLVGGNRAGTSAEVFVLECKGTHGGFGTVGKQLTKARRQVKSVELGNRAPGSLTVASQFAKSGVTAHVLGAPGSGNLWSGSTSAFHALLDREPERGELVLRSPTGDENSSEPPRIVHVPEDHRTWFLQVLTRFAAASALRFAGDMATAKQYTSPRDDAPRQLSLFDEQLSREPSPEASLDTFTLPDGTTFEGRLYTVSLPHRKVLRVRCGLESRLYHALRDGQLARYWQHARKVHGRLSGERGRWASDDGVISVGPGGTIMTIDVAA